MTSHSIMTCVQIYYLHDPKISHTTLHVWGLVVGYTHVNVQFQVISLNIPKHNCAFLSVMS